MNSKLKSFLQYFLGVLLLLSSLSLFGEGSIGVLGGFCVVSTALICIPKTRQLIESKFNFRFSSSVKYLLVIFGWISIAIFSKSTKPEKVDELAKTDSTEVRMEGIMSVPQEVSKIDDSTIQKDKLNLQTSEKTIAENTIQLSTKSKSITTKKTKRISNTSGQSGYILGPRGGCYYINSKGRKVYVDHSYCY